MKSQNRLALLVLALAVSLCAGSPSRAENLTAQSGKVIQLMRAGKYAEALPLAQAMLAQLDKGPPGRDFAGALNNLAQVYGDMGRDAEAEPLYKRSLAVMEKAAGLDSVDMAPELNNLAALYQRQFRYAEAEPRFKRALAIYQTRLATSTFDLLKADPKLGRAEALRRAMLAYLGDTSSPRNAYPALWGPFALIGEGEIR